MQICLSAKIQSKSPTKAAVQRNESKYEGKFMMSGRLHLRPEPLWWSVVVYRLGYQGIRHSTYDPYIRIAQIYQGRVSRLPDRQISLAHDLRVLPYRHTLAWNPSYVPRSDEASHELAESTSTMISFPSRPWMTWVVSERASSSETPTMVYKFEPSRRKRGWGISSTMKMTSCGGCGGERSFPSPANRIFVPLRQPGFTSMSNITQKWELSSTQTKKYYSPT